jgi:hypothetical protein
VRRGEGPLDADQVGRGHEELHVVEGQVVLGR